MPGSTGHLLSDEVGLVTADREIGVFDKTIHPGSEGEFDFEIINPHAKNIVYEMDVKQYYNGQEVTDFPMFYKLKMNNVYIAGLDNWVSYSSLSFANLIIPDNSTQSFTLEWCWPFESGDDEHDTLLGVDNGSYHIVVSVRSYFEGE